MIRMKAEAVVISKPGVQNHVNGANVNMNGKVILADVMDKGYKGAGRLNGEVVLCVAEGDREKKVAETAMNILTKHIPAIKTGGDSFQIEAESFFNHAARETSLSDGEYSTLSATLVFNYGDCVYIANCGKNAVYTYDEMYLTRIDFGTEEASSDVENVMPALAFDRIDSITPNTKIIVMSNELYEYTTDEQILSILRGAESVKQACQNLIDQATENGAQKSITVLMENLVPVDVPLAGAPIGVPAEDAVPEQDAEAEAEETEPDVSRPSKAPLVVLILLLLLVALIAGLYFGNQYYHFIEKLFGGNTEPSQTTTEITESQTEPVASLITISELPSTSASDTTVTTTERDSEREGDNTTTRRTISSTTERDTTRNRTTDPTTAPTTEEPSGGSESTEPSSEPTDPSSEPSSEPTDPSSEPSSEPSNVTPSSTDSGREEPEPSVSVSTDEPGNELEDD
ncbi:MAG: hypothetical protein IJL26_01010 [Clostridia bacterium]|nr:hypothetical protein [Clostridia bacterium]